MKNSGNQVCDLVSSLQCYVSSIKKTASSSATIWDVTSSGYKYYPCNEQTEKKDEPHISFLSSFNDLLKQYSSRSLRIVKQMLMLQTKS